MRFFYFNLFDKLVLPPPLSEPADIPYPNVFNTLAPVCAYVFWLPSNARLRYGKPVLIYGKTLPKLDFTSSKNPSYKSMNFFV